MDKREQKRRKMADVIERWERSGKSARAFSEEAQVAESRLRYWRSRIRREAVAQPGFVPVTILPDEPAVGSGVRSVIRDPAWIREVSVTGTVIR